MAASFDRQYAKFEVLLVLFLLCLQVNLNCCKRRKHQPVVAFFQGHCEQNICDQRCREIDNGGYACECYEGYTLNHDGISCSEISQDGTGHEDVNLERPDIVKIVPVDPNAIVDINLNSDSSIKLQENPGEVLTFDKSFISKDSSTEKPAPLETPSETKSSHSNRISNDVSFGKSEIKSDGSEHSKNDKSDTVVLGNDLSSIDSVRRKANDKTADVPSVETVNFKSSETSGQNENLQNLVPNPLPPKSPADNLVTTERCHKNSCLNRGKCVDDGTPLRNKVRCDCKLGTLGNRCENEVDVRFPLFYGYSFLALPVLKAGYKELDLEIEFKPKTATGLLVFSAEFEDARSDFFSLTLQDGRVEFRFDCGTGIGLVRSETPVVLNQWNTVKLLRIENQATLWVNNGPPSNGSSQGSYSRLTLRLNLYLGGYDNVSKIRDRTGISQGFEGCIEKIVVNGYQYDLRKADLVGDAQFGVNIDECSEGLCDSVVCNNGGSCKVTSADSHVCLCPLGTGGENCQHEVDVHIPEFLGHSYLEFPGLGRSALLFMEIELVFKATKADGTILYNGYKQDRSGDFISLALHGGFLEFRFDLGTGPAILRSPSPVTLNHWHWVKLSRTGMEGVMEIDGHVAAINQSQGAFTQLTVTQSLFLGGHRNFDETSMFANISKAFDGCIQKFVINKQLVDLIRDAISGINVENCEHPCVGEPCLHGGECKPRKDVYICYCPLGYSGQNCQNVIDRSTSVPRFSSDSFLMFQKDIGKRLSGEQLDIHFSLKPESRDGLLLWSGPDVMQATSDYVAIGFKDGILQFQYNLGSGEAVISYNSTKLFDGKWHDIHVQRDKQNGYLSIDGREIVEGNSTGSFTVLNTNKLMYIGGLPDVPQGTLSKFTAGYSGCIQDFVLDQDISVSLLSSSVSGRNVVPCS